MHDKVWRKCPSSVQPSSGRANSAGLEVSVSASELHAARTVGHAVSKCEAWQLRFGVRLEGQKALQVTQV